MSAPERQAGDASGVAWRYLFFLCSVGCGPARWVSLIPSRRKNGPEFRRLSMNREGRAHVARGAALPSAFARRRHPGPTVEGTQNPLFAQPSSWGIRRPRIGHF